MRRCWQSPTCTRAQLYMKTASATKRKPPTKQRKIHSTDGNIPLGHKTKRQRPLTVVVGKVHEGQVRVVVAEGRQEAQPRGLQEPYHLRRETRKKIGVQ